MTPPNAAEIVATLRGTVVFDTAELVMGDRKKFREKHLDWLAQLFTNHPDPETRRFVKWILQTICQFSGVLPASIHGFYKAKGEKKYDKKTAAAVMVEKISYDEARSLIRTAQSNNAMAVLFELPLGADYDDAVTLFCAAALRENRSGSLFFQITIPVTDPSQIEACKVSIQNAVRAGIYNLSFDTSGLIDTAGPTFETQQQPNFTALATLLKFVRTIQPEGITVSVGGAISGRTSVVDELRGAMDGLLQTQGDLPESVCKITLTNSTAMTDNKLLEQLSEVAIGAYHLGGIAILHAPDAVSLERLSSANVAEVRCAVAGLDANLRSMGAHNTVDPIGETVEAVKVKPVFPETFKNLLVR